MKDRDIVIGLKQRDPKAMEALINVYGDRLFRSAFLLCGVETDARDLVQDTLIEAVKSAPRFRGRSAVV